jgi:hypothetical protein
MNGTLLEPCRLPSPLGNVLLAGQPRLESQLHQPWPARLSPGRAFLFPPAYFLAGLRSPRRVDVLADVSSGYSAPLRSREPLASTPPPLKPGTGGAS